LANSTTLYSMTLATLFLGAAGLAAPARAQSCGEAVNVVHSSYPADGAMGVPTNAPLYIYGPELDAVTSDVTLEDESGTAVMIDVQAADGGLLVDAFLGLDPNTTYELTVSSGAGGEEWSASFTTGARPAMIAQLRPPDVGVSVIEQDRGTCGVVSAICVIGSVSAGRTLELLIGDEVLSLGSGQPAPAYAVDSGAIAANACIDVRVREPGGSVSEATRLCGNELGRFELAANAPAPTSCQAYRTVAVAAADDDSESSSDSGGCALGAASRAASGTGGLLLGLAVLVAARRRRRSAAGARAPSHDLG
jgi:hypothetical protein